MERSYSTSRLGPGIKISSRTRRVVYDRLEAFKGKSEPISKGRRYDFGGVRLLHNIGPQPEFVLSSRLKRGLDRVAGELGLPLE